jgi:formiminotetrahydrofolate cyclodeaminase
MHRLVEDSDQAPIPAALEEQQRIKAAYTEALQAFNNFVSTDVAAFNSAMTSRKLPGLVAGEPVKP